jgi:hypothetical protein
MASVETQEGRAQARACQRLVRHRGAGRLGQGDAPQRPVVAKEREPLLRTASQNPASGA